MVLIYFTLKRKIVMRAKDIISFLVQFAPHALLFAMVASFGLVGYFAAIKIVGHGFFVAVAVSVVLQVIRLAAGLSSSEFFRRQEWGKALIVLTFSLCLTIYEAHGANDMFVVVLVWSGLFLELFLGMTLMDN